MPDKLETYSIKEKSQCPRRSPSPPYEDVCASEGSLGGFCLFSCMFWSSLSAPADSGPKETQEKGKSPASLQNSRSWLSTLALAFPYFVGNKGLFQSWAFCSCSRGGDNLTQGGDAEQIWFGQSLREATLCRVYTLGALLALLYSTNPLDGAHFVILKPHSQQPHYSMTTGS